MILGLYLSLLPTHPYPTPRLRLSTTWQAYLMSGLMVLAFEIIAVPNLTPRLGVRMSQRLGSIFEIPVYFLIPLISRVNGAEFPVDVAAVILLFTCYVTSNSVSPFALSKHVNIKRECDGGSAG